MSAEDVYKAIDNAISRGYIIIHKKALDDVAVYANRMPLRLPPEAAEGLEKYLDLNQEDEVVHLLHCHDQCGQTVTVGLAFFGVKP